MTAPVPDSSHSSDGGIPRSAAAGGSLQPETVLSAERVPPKFSYPGWLLLLFSPVALLNAWLSRNMLSYGADGMQYINIAGEYAAANWEVAINAYWGPLVSWLMAPLIVLGVDPVLAFKLERALTAVFFLAVWLRVMQRLRLSRLSAGLGMLCGMGFALQWMLHETPDLLWAALLLLWLHLLTGRAYLRSNSTAMIAGAVGAAIYLTKSFGFPFVITNLFAVLCWRIWVSRDAGKAWKLLTRGSVSLGTFLGLSLIWILVISIHYEQSTIGTSGSYNKLVLGPSNSATEIISSSFVLPTFSGELEAPAREGFVCSWQEPYLAALALGLPDWSVFEESRHFSLNMFRNFKALAYNDALFAYGILALLLMAWSWLRNSWMKRDRLVLLLLALTIANMIAGYLLILVQDRYLWGVEAIMVLGLLLLADRLMRRESIVTGFLPLALVTFVSLALNVRVMAESYGPGNDHRVEFELREALAAEALPHPVRMASVDEPRPGSYRKGVLVSSGLGATYFGVLADTLRPERSLSQLDRHAVNCLMIDAENELYSKSLLQTGCGWSVLLRNEHWLVLTR